AMVLPEICHVVQDHSSWYKPLPEFSAIVEFNMKQVSKVPSQLCIPSLWFLVMADCLMVSMQLRPIEIPEPPLCLMITRSRFTIAFTVVESHFSTYNPLPVL
ncbi:MAG: hypothetical protein QXD73_06095, partial [Candidatus Bathyarchaeia archaeon]